MNCIMDDFTFLGYYSRPVDTSRVRVIRADGDGYVPACDTVPPVDEIWRDVTLVNVQGGHIMSYLTQQGLFRQEIARALNCA